MTTPPAAVVIQAVVLWGVSFALSAALSGLVAVIARRIGFVAHPNPVVESHTTPVPLGGGIAVSLVVLVLLGVLASLGRIPWRLPAALLPVALLGSADDVFRFSPAVKFALQCGSVVFYLLLAPLPARLLLPVGLFLLVTQNAWNLIDIMDGLLGRISAIAFSGAAVACLAMGRLQPLGLTAAVGAGATGGFLTWNSAPARMYLGDAGSLMLGMLFGLLPAEALLKEPTAALPILVMGLIPIFELFFLIVERTRKHLRFYHKSPDHFALRLLHRGYPVSAIVARVSWVGIALVIVGWLAAWQRARRPVLLSVLVVVAAAGVCAWCLLSRIPAREMDR